MEREAKDGIGRRVGGAIGGALDLVLHRVGGATQLLGEVFRLRTTGAGAGSVRYGEPGAAPGIEHDPNIKEAPRPGEVSIVCTDYGPSGLAERTVAIAELQALPRPDWATVRWVRVVGLHAHVVNRIREIFGFHTLAAEDVLEVPQRARAETYDEAGHLFVVTQMIAAKPGGLTLQQISMFVQPALVVSFQEGGGAEWAPLMARLRKPNTRLRTSDGGYLAYALLDMIVDHCFPVLDQYAQRLAELEQQVLDAQGSDLLRALHSVRRELAVLRGLLWPTRELLSDLQRVEQGLITSSTRAFLGDVHDHCLQLTDMLETFRDLASNLTELHLSLSNHRMGEVMQLLTVLSMVFMPITFLAGVYGMNFKHIPELDEPAGYPLFWALCGLSTVVLLWLFKRKGWL